MKFLRRLLLLLLLVFIVIQFFRPAKNRSEGPQPNAIATVLPVPDSVKVILDKACTDCHSNNTKYPWYNNIQPVAWWMNNHVNDGKRELNFDEFASYRPRRQYNKLKQSQSMVAKGLMPLKSYTWIHKNAILTDAEKQIISTWVDSSRAMLERRYPIDSLVKKNNPPAKY